MENLVLAKDDFGSFTVLSNCFIDNYIADANDAQIKIYLYLLRTIQSGKATDISDMADTFNYSEKDVMRALQYWDKKGILSLSFSSTKELSGITLLTPSKPGNNSVIDAKVSSKETSMSTNSIISSENTIVSSIEQDVVDNSSVTLDEVKAFTENLETKQMIMIAEQYLGRPLSNNDIHTIIFIYNRLKFNVNLMDYLFQYCIEKGKKDFHYIESVARNWHEKNITTVSQARKQSFKYDKSVYTIMNALGRSSSPTDEEATFILRWINEYGIELDAIKYACSKTVIATDSHRFEYCEGILKQWVSQNIFTLDAAKQKTLEHERAKSESKKRNSTKVPKFAQFSQRDYDYDALAEKIAD